MKRNEKKWKLTHETKKEDLNTDKILKNKAANDIGGYRNAVTKSYKYIGHISNDSTDLITFNAEAYKYVAQNQLKLF